MKIYVKFIILCIFLIPLSLSDFSVSAQTSGKTDSLHKIISSLSDNQEKAKNLLLLITAYYDARQMDSAWKYNEKARELLEMTGDKAGLAETFYNEGKINNRKSDYQAANAPVSQYIKMIKLLNDEAGLCKGFYLYANLLMKRGEADSAIFYYHECLTINLSLKDTLRYIAIYNALGNLFQESTSQFDSAAYYYLKTIRLCQSTGRENLLGKIYNNLGKTFTRLREYDQARKYLELAYEYNKKINDTREMALNLINLGANYLRQEVYDTALIYFDQSSALLKPLGQVQETIDLYNNYAALYKEKGQYEQALSNYFKALSYYRSQKLWEGTINAMRNIGDIYKRQKKYDLGREYLDSSLALATSKGYQQFELDILRSLFLFYYEVGDFKKAFDFQAEYRSLQDSLYNLDKTKLISDLTMKYEKEQDQSRILALEKENLRKDLSIKHRTIQRNAFLFAVMILLILALFLFLYTNQRRKKDSIIAQQKIRQLEEEKKLLAARALVEGQEEERKRIANELHDGLGVLLSATKMQFTAIRDTNPENIPLIKKATQLLEQATGDVRIISHNMMPGLLTKLGLFEAVEDLFDNINDKKTLKANCEIPEDLKRLPENQEIMVYRIIQEMVNNSLKHAEAKNIRLRIQVLENMLELHYSDDGKGFDVQQMMESKSLGLKSIQSRVDFLNGKLTLDSKSSMGTTYIIEIPYNIQ